MGHQLQARVLVFAATFSVFVFLIASVPHAAAGRALSGEQWASRNHGAARTSSTLFLDKLPKGAVTPSMGSPCTNIPGQGTGHCMFINGINVAGRVVRSMPTFPSADLSTTWRAFRAVAKPEEQ